MCESVEELRSEIEAVSRQVEILDGLVKRVREIQTGESGMNGEVSERKKNTGILEAHPPRLLSSRIWENQRSITAVKNDVKGLRQELRSVEERVTAKIEKTEQASENRNVALRDSISAATTTIKVMIGLLTLVMAIAAIAALGGGG